MTYLRFLIFPLIFFTSMAIPFFVRFPQINPSSSALLAPSSTPSPNTASNSFSQIHLPPTATPTPRVGIPVKIEIPAISLSASVVKLGLTSTGGLDVPQNALDVGWFDGSPRPGLPGGTVLAGHYDTPSGRPAAFYRLRELKPQDKVLVTTDRNEVLEFFMEREVTLPYKSFPLDLVYGTIEGEELRIITCDGVWNAAEKSYSNRLVIFAKRQT